ncbi:MAG: hypothetical protein WDZ41_01870 [Candidatus Babeliales bacterium]
MRKLLILFICCLQMSSWSISQGSLIDSTTISNAIRLLADFKACEEYSSEIETRLISARELIGRLVVERNELVSITDELDNALKQMTIRKEKLERKLKRTRIIGVVGVVGGLIVGVLLVFLI